jgi:four helix bundle protein
MKIEKFEDIEAWKQGRELAKDIYAVTGKGGFAKDYGLRDQIQRATVSIMANISEGLLTKVTYPRMNSPSFTIKEQRSRS